MSVRVELVNGIVKQWDQATGWAISDEGDLKLYSSPEGTQAYTVAIVARGQWAIVQQAEVQELPNGGK